MKNITKKYRIINKRHFSCTSIKKAYLKGFFLISLIIGSINVSGQMKIGTNFWFRTDWSGETPFKAGVDFATTTDPWNPVFLGELYPYTLLRFMDWHQTNLSGQSSWDTRRQKTDPNQKNMKAADPAVAIEWMIDLCNRTNKDMWFCVPHLMVSKDLGNNPCDYALRSAILIKTGVDMKAVDLSQLGDLSTKTQADFIKAGGVKTIDPLKSNLKIYIEYSNETWNGAFSQFTHCRDNGLALNLGGKDGFEFHGWAAIRVFRAYDLVFGTSSTKRHVKVRGGMMGVASPFNGQQKMFISDVHNPWNVKADAYAIAPYFGNADGASLDAIAVLRNNIRTKVGPGIRTVLNAIQKSSTPIDLIAYEGGQHVTTNADIVNKKPEMYGLYKEYLDTLKKYMNLFVNYAHCGKPGSSGAWGVKEYTGQPISEAHKYRALVDWSKANPASMPTEVEEQTINSGFTIFPNPSHDIINVSSYDPEISIENNEIIILNSIGEEVVKTEKVDRISIDHLSAGIYFLTVRNKEKRFTQKIFIE